MSILGSRAIDSLANAISAEGCKGGGGAPGREVGRWSGVAGGERRVPAHSLLSGLRVPRCVCGGQGFREGVGGG